MALTFATGTNNVSCGSAASIDDTIVSVIMWVRPAVIGVTAQVLISKYRGVANEGWSLNNGAADANGNVQMLMECSTADAVYITNNSPLVAGRWAVIAATWDRALMTARVFSGTTTALIAECSYGTASPGTGTMNSDASRTLMIGNRDAATPNAVFVGDIAAAAVFSRAPSLDEMRQWQQAPYVMPGCVGFWKLGANGTSAQIDRSNYANHGTVTGATWAPTPDTLFRRSPRRAWFDQAAASVYGVRGFPRGMFHGMNRRVDVGRIAG